MASMQRSALNYRTALLMALAISLLLNVLFMIMFFYGRDAVLPPDGERPRTPFNFQLVLGHIAANFMVAFALYLINFRLVRNERFKQWWAKWIFIIAVTLLSTAVLSYACSWIQLQWQDFGANPAKFIRGSMMRDYFISVVVMFSSQLLYLTEKQQQTALENESLMAENIKNRFTALRNQTDPHFLFNSLNTLNALIKTEPDKAQEYVQQLSQVFRYTLQNKEVITLEEELRFTASYCHLMQIRYGDSLRFEERIDAKLSTCLVIPLSVQTLVENAIKHNVVTKKQPLVITIATGEGTLSVSNPVQLKKEAEEGGGIGLANLAEHYRLMWRREIEVNRTSQRFEVTIPLIKP